jgi:hypothetical protein
MGAASHKPALFITIELLLIRAPTPVIVQKHPAAPLPPEAPVITGAALYE